LAPELHRSQLDSGSCRFDNAVRSILKFRRLTSDRRPFDSLHLSRRSFNEGGTNDSQLLANVKCLDDPVSRFSSLTVYLPWRAPRIRSLSSVFQVRFWP